MNTKIKLAIVAALFSAVASPALAVEQGSEQARMVSTGAYAAATWTERHHAPAHWHMSTISFQAQGSR